MTSGAVSSYSQKQCRDLWSLYLCRYNAILNFWWTSSLPSTPTFPNTSSCPPQCTCHSMLFPKHRIMDPQDGFGWNGPLKPSNSNPLSWAGTLPTKPGCSVSSIRSLPIQPSQSVMGSTQTKPFHTTLSSSHTPASHPLTQRDLLGCHSSFCDTLFDEAPNCALTATRAGSSLMLSSPTSFTVPGEAKPLQLLSQRSNPLWQKAVLTNWQDSGGHKGGQEGEHKVWLVSGQNGSQWRIFRTFASLLSSLFGEGKHPASFTNTKCSSEEWMFCIFNNQAIYSNV